MLNSISCSFPVYIAIRFSQEQWALPWSKALPLYQIYFLQRADKLAFLVEKYPNGNKSWKPKFYSPSFKFENKQTKKHFFFFKLVFYIWQIHTFKVKHYSGKLSIVSIDSVLLSVCQNWIHRASFLSHGSFDWGRGCLIVVLCFFFFFPLTLLNGLDS